MRINRKIGIIACKVDSYNALFRVFATKSCNLFPLLFVRRQGFWDRWRPELREDLAHLVGLIMRRIWGEASIAFR